MTPIRVYGSVHEPELFEPGVRVRHHDQTGYPSTGIIIGTTPDEIIVRWHRTPKNDKPVTMIHKPSNLYLDTSVWAVRAHCARWLEIQTERKFYWMLDGPTNIHPELAEIVLAVSVNRVLTDGRPVREIFGPWQQTTEGWWARYSFLDGRVVSRKQDCPDLNRECWLSDAKAHAVGFWLIGFSDQLEDGGEALEC